MSTVPYISLQRSRRLRVNAVPEERGEGENVFGVFFFPLLLRATLSPPNKLRSADKTFHLLGDIATVTGLHGAICEPPKRPLAEPKGKKNKNKEGCWKTGKSSRCCHYGDWSESHPVRRHNLARQ